MHQEFSWGLWWCSLPWSWSGLITVKVGYSGVWPWPCSLIMSSRHSPTTTKNNEHFSSITCFLYTNTWERPEYCKYHEVFVVYFKSQHKQDSLIPFFWIFLISWKPDKLWSFLNVMDWSCCLESSLKQSTWARLVSHQWAKTSSRRCESRIL